MVLRFSSLSSLCRAPRTLPLPTRTHRHSTTPSRLLHSITSSPSPPPPCSPLPLPRRAVRRSARFVEFSGFPRILPRSPVRGRPRRRVLSRLFTYCRRTTSVPLVCNESWPTSERSESRVDITRADCRACDAQNKTGLTRSSKETILLIDLVTYFAHSHKVLTVKYLPILPILRTHFTHTRKTRRSSRCIKAPTHNKRSGVWVWAYKKNGPGLEGQNPYKDKLP